MERRSRLAAERRGLIMRTAPRRNRGVPGTCGKTSLKLLSGHGFNLSRRAVDRAENQAEDDPFLTAVGPSEGTAGARK